MIFAIEIVVLVCKKSKFSACGGLIFGKASFSVGDFLGGYKSPPQAEKNWGYNYKNTGIYKNTPPLISKSVQRGGILIINTPDTVYYNQLWNGFLRY